MKLTTAFVCTLMLITIVTAKAQVGIGTTAPAVAAQLDVNSTTKDFLPPRMTLLQRKRLPAPVAGLMIYCTDRGSNGQIQYYDGKDWVNAIGASATLPANYRLGTDIAGAAATT